MPAAVSVRRDFSASELRRVAAVVKNANQSRRLLSLAAVLDGMNRAQAARIGGMDRQTLRDWVHRFNAHGPDGSRTAGRKGTRHACRRISRRSWRSSLRPAPTEWRTASCGGAASTYNASSPNASASSTTSARSARSSSSSASLTSARADATRLRMGRPSRRSKKLCRDAEGSSGRRRQGQAGRDLVPGRGPHRPEERDRPTMGETRVAAAPTGRPAL
jgi:transposase-like protein